MTPPKALDIAEGVSGLAPIGGGRLAVGGHSGEVAVWDVWRGTLRSWWNVCPGNIAGVAGADGLVAAWGRDSVWALSPGGVWSHLSIDGPVRVTARGHRLLVETVAGGLTEWRPTEAVVRHWQEGDYRTRLVPDGDGVTVRVTCQGAQRLARLDTESVAELRAGGDTHCALVGAAQLDGPILVGWGSDGTVRRSGACEGGPLSDLADVTKTGLRSTYRRPGQPGHATRDERLSIIGDAGTGANLGRLRDSSGWTGGARPIGDGTAIVRWSARLQLPGMEAVETRSHWATGFAELGPATVAFCLDAGGVAVVDAHSLRSRVVGTEHGRAAGLVPLSQGRVLVAGEDGCVRILDAARGHSLAVRRLEGAWLWGAVELDDNCLVLWTDAGRLQTWVLDGDEDGLCS